MPIAFKNRSQSKSGCSQNQPGIVSAAKVMKFGSSSL